MKTYIHQTQGRLRVRSEAIRQQPQQIQALFAQLKQIDAITELRHRQHAGSITVFFDPQQLTQQNLLDVLESQQLLDERPAPKTVQWASVMIKEVVKGVTGVVLQRFFGGAVYRVYQHLL